MIRFAMLFFVLALGSYIIGVNELGGVSFELGELFVFIFLVLAILSFISSIFGKHDQMF